MREPMRARAGCALSGVDVTLRVGGVVLMAFGMREVSPMQWWN